MSPTSIVSAAASASSTAAAMSPRQLVLAFYSPLLFGGLLAFMFSGMIVVQCIVYFKLYPDESYFKKGLVILVWFLDIAHSVLVTFILFHYFISMFGFENLPRIPEVHWAIPASFFVTGMQTLITHSVLTHKIHRSGGSNWWITSPIIALIITRQGVITFAVIELLLHKNFSRFAHSNLAWSWTVGLSLSAGIDVVIAGCLFYFLRRFRKRMSTTMVAVVDALTRYTMESGFLTCLVTSAVLITWITLPKSFVALGLHFTVSKLYINSLLASLNTRKELEEMRFQMEEATIHPPVFSPDDFLSLRPRHPAAIVNPLDVHLDSRRKSKIQINVQRSRKVEHSSLDSLSDMMYPKTVPLNRPMVLEWKSGSLNSVNTLSSVQTDVRV